MVNEEQILGRLRDDIMKLDIRRIENMPEAPLLSTYAVPNCFEVDYFVFSCFHGVMSPPVVGMLY